MHSTERAALRLALGLLRRFLHLSPLRRPERAAENDLDAAAMILAIDEDLPTGAGDMPAIVALGNALIATEAMEAVPARLLRARLALYLRAVLRAEAGDFGRWTEAGCGSRQARGIGPPFPPYCYYGVNPGERAHAFVATRRQPPPLWSQAPGRKA